MTSRLFRNILSGWVVFAAAILFGFFLTPYILSRVGVSHYGLWVLAASLSGYLGLFDLGWAPAITTRVAAAWQAGDHRRASLFLSAALWLHVAGGLAAALGAFTLAHYADRIFILTEAEAPIAAQLIRITGITVAVGLPLSVFGTALSGGLFHFDRANAVDLAAVALRAILTVAVLETGRSVVALAWAVLAVALFSHLARVVLLLRRWPQLRLSLPPTADPVWRDLARFGGWGFVWIAAERFLIYFGALVVGARFSAQAAAVWGVAAKWGEYLRLLARSASEVHLSFLARQTGDGATAHREVHIRNTILLLGSVLIAACTLWINGAAILLWWVGPIATQAVIPMRWMVAFGVAAAVGLPAQAAWVAQDRLRHSALAAATLTVLAIGSAMLVPASMGLPGVAAAIALPAVLIWGIGGAVVTLHQSRLASGESRRAFTDLGLLIAVAIGAQTSVGWLAATWGATARVAAAASISAALLALWLVRCARSSSRC